MGGSAGFEFADFGEAGAEAGFEALVGRFVPGTGGKIFGEAGHVSDFFVEVVGVFVAFAIADVFHEAGDGVAKTQRNGIGFGLADIGHHGAVSGVESVGLGRKRKIDGGLGEREMAFWGAEKIESIFGGESDGESAGFGEADVFTGHANHAASEIERIFAGFDHAREPIESGIGIGIADGFVQRGDEIVVLFAGFVVAEKLALENVFEQLGSDFADAARVWFGTAGTEFKGVVSGAGVAIGEAGDAEEEIVGSLQILAAQTTFVVVEGATEKLDNLRGSERFEDINLGAREKRGNHFEGGILRGRADEDDVAGFYVREKSVLLGLVEAVDFVHEDDSAMARAGLKFGGGHYVFDFLDARENGTESHEIGFGKAGNEASESGFAAARRPPEEHGAKVVAFDLHAERLAGAEELFLADEFVEGARAHALSERLIGEQSVGVRFAGGDGSKEAHGVLKLV